MTEHPPRVIRLHPSDNVAVALEDVNNWYLTYGDTDMV